MFHHIYLFIILFKIRIKSPTKGMDKNYPFSPHNTSSCLIKKKLFFLYKTHLCCRAAQMRLGRLLEPGLVRLSLPQLIEATADHIMVYYSQPKTG